MEKVSTEKEKTRLRVQKHREKLKLDEEKLKTLKEADKLRKREARAKEKAKLQANVHTFSGKRDLQLKRLKETERKRAQRLKKKLTSQAEKGVTCSSFKSIQSLGKAAQRLKRVLPKSPSKKLAVVKKLIYDELPQLKSTAGLFKDINAVGTNNKDRLDTEELIRAFYARDDVSRQAPGMRDVKSIKDEKTGDKVKLQKRHMTMSVKEAYAYFVTEHKEVKIKKSKFYELRPKHILLSSQMPHNVCVCEKHANFNYIVEALKKKIEGFPKTGRELITKTVCDISHENCMTGTCDKCKSKEIKNCIPPTIDQSNIMTWNQWIEKNKRPVICEVSGTIADAVEVLQKQLSKFKIHCHVKNVQSKVFEEKKQKLLKKEALIQIDFAENFSCIAQDEIQSAHWNNTLVTIFTCVAWMDGLKKCYAIISDDLTHDKHCVWVFLKVIIDDLKAKYNVEDVTLFSDGAASQFKNRYTLTNLCYLQEDYNVEGEWCFFATSHGKGAVDGVGGTVKRLVWERVQNRQAIVSSAEDFYNVCSKATKSIEVKLVLHSVIDKHKAFLEERWSNITAIPKIQSSHYFRASTQYPGNIVCGRTYNSELHKYTVCLGLDRVSDSDSLMEIVPSYSQTRLAYHDVYSDSEEESVADIRRVQKKDIKPGQYLLVQQLGQNRNQKNHTYIVVTQSTIEEDEDIEVYYMVEIVSQTPKGNTSVGPTFKVDETKSFSIKYCEVIGILPEPQLKQAGNRVFYQFPKNIPGL